MLHGAPKMLFKNPASHPLNPSKTISNINTRNTSVSKLMVEYAVQAISKTYVHNSYSIHIY